MWWEVVCGDSCVVGVMGCGVWWVWWDVVCGGSGGMWCVVGVVGGGIWWDLVGGGMWCKVVWWDVVGGGIGVIFNFAIIFGPFLTAFSALCYARCVAFPT